jgi:3',5'-cyclic AMP phosphodiesterase CpdA
MLFLTINFVALMILCSNNYSFALENQTPNKETKVFNIIAVADVGCSLRAQENIKNIEKLDPELFLVSGDLSYEKTPDCWFNMTKSLDSKTKIAIGNHDDYEEEGAKGESLQQSLLNHYNLNKPYYSFDYQNVHVLVLDTQLELSVDTLESTAIIDQTTTTNTIEDDNKGKKDKKDKDTTTIDEKKEPLLERFPLVDIADLLEQNSIDVEIPPLDKIIESNAKVPALKVDNEQYQFVLEDLEKTSQNKNIDWIFVMFHKPMYSPLSKQFEEYIIRDKYQPIFDKYGVDLVIQGHNHIYSRTLPLSLNKLDISQPIVDKNSSSTSNNNNIFTNPQGTIFLVVGVGGEELYRIESVPYYVANHYNKGFGFADIKIDGKRLDVKVYDINLNCQLKITQKKEQEVIDPQSCLPPTPGNDKLKVIDYFTIIK